MTIVRSIAGRIRRSARRLRWHASRVWLQCREAAPRGPRLPPGSLAASSLHGVDAPDFYLRLHRRHGAVFKLFWPSRRLKVCVVGFPIARRLFTRHADALQPVTIDITPFVPKGFLRCMAGQDHAHYRRLFKSALRGNLVDLWEAELRSMLRGELAALAAADADCATPEAHTLRAVDRIAANALLTLLLGTPSQDERFEALERAFRRLGPHGLVHPVGPPQAEAFAGIRALVLPLIAERRSAPPGRLRECLLDRVLAAHATADTDATFVGNTIYMVEMGRHDIKGLLRWVLKYLSDNPVYAEEIRALGARSDAGRELAQACVLETLRMDQAESLNRTATAPLVFEGYRVPQGSHVSVLLRESHRDPITFPDPDRFDPHRFVQRDYTSDAYAPFGIGAHQCVAADLVVRLGGLFVQELVEGYDWSVVSDGPRHRAEFHWEPSPRFAVALQGRGSVIKA